jgi:hypothetical protein
MLSRMLCATSFLDGKSPMGLEFLFRTSASKSTFTSSHLVLCLTIVDRQTVSLSDVVVFACGFEVRRFRRRVLGSWSMVVPFLFCEIATGLRGIDGLTGRQYAVTNESVLFSFQRFPPKVKKLAKLVGTIRVKITPACIFRAFLFDAKILFGGWHFIFPDCTFIRLAYSDLSPDVPDGSLLLFACRTYSSTMLELPTYVSNWQNLFLRAWRFFSRRVLLLVSHHDYNGLL